MEIFSAQDRIISAGDVGTELYFVAVGEVQVASWTPSLTLFIAQALPSAGHEKGSVIKVLHEGEKWARCDVRSTYCGICVYTHIKKYHVLALYSICIAIYMT